MVRKVQIVGVMSVALSNQVADRSAEKYVINSCFLLTVEEGVPVPSPFAMQEEEAMKRLQSLIASRRRSPCRFVGAFR